MNKFANITCAILIVLNSITGCNDKTPVSPYDEILSQPPYAAISDSIKKDPKKDDLYFRRAVLLNENNLPEPSLADFKKAWSLKKEEKYALAIGNLLMDKKPDAAISFLQEASQTIPASALLQLTLARVYDSENKTDEALKICNDILQKYPEQVDVLKMKADLLEKKGNTAEAIKILERAYSLTPYDVELNYLLALKFAVTKNSKVLNLCDSLIKADSSESHAEPYYYKGIYYATINNKAKALLLFDEAVRHDYYFLEGYTEKGALLYEMKKYTEALDVFNLALTISPKYADNYYWIGKCQEAMDQKEEAKLNYQRAYSLDNTLQQAKEAAERIKN